MNIYKLASRVDIEVFGGNAIGKLDKLTDKKKKELGIQLDKDGKVISIPPKWQSNKKSRFHITIGENKVPEWVLEVPLVKVCLDNGKMTKGELVSGKKTTTSKTKKKTTTSKTKPTKPKDIKPETDELPPVE
jgi:hypothetical protein